MIPRLVNSLVGEEGEPGLRGLLCLSIASIAHIYMSSHCVLCIHISYGGDTYVGNARRATCAMDQESN